MRNLPYTYIWFKIFKECIHPISLWVLQIPSSLDDDALLYNGILLSISIPSRNRLTQSSTWRRNGNSLQYSYLENPTDGGTWEATVHGVAESQTQLRDFAFTHWRRKWQPTPVFLPGESQGQRSLVGCHLWGRTSRTWLKRLSSSSKVVQFLNAKEIFFPGPILFLCYIIPHFLYLIATNYTPNLCKWLVCDNKSISREMLKCRINLAQTLTNWPEPWINVIWTMGMWKKKKSIASVCIYLSLSLSYIHTHTQFVNFCHRKSNKRGNNRTKSFEVLSNLQFYFQISSEMSSGVDTFAWEI